MKKALAMALGGLMAAGYAAPAQAGSYIDFNGYYRAYALTDSGLSRGVGTKDSTQSYMGHRLELNFTFTPTDEIAVFWRMRAPDFQAWGNNGGGIEGDQFTTEFIYGQIKQDWGTVLVGKFDDALDVYGLASLGYQPSSSWTNNVGPFDPALHIDAVRFSKEYDNGFGIMAQYAIVDAWGSQDGDDIATSERAILNNDRFNLEATYKWDGGGAALGVIYEHNKLEYDAQDELWWAMDSRSIWFINPAIMQSFGNFSVHFEGMIGWASQDAVAPGRRDRDSSGYGFYLDGDYNYGPGNVTMAGWWTSGTDYNNNGDRDDLVQIDQGNFYPLVVAYNNTVAGWSGTSNNFGSAVGLANDMGQAGLVGGDGTRNNRQNDGTSNHWALALTGNHAFTDDISMNYAVAYLALVESNYRIATTSAFNAATNTTTYGYSTQDKDLGFEVDLGFTFKLLDNLDFNTTFGYMFSGDAYRTVKNTTTNTAGTASRVHWDDPEDSYVWYNTLTFNF